MRSKFDLDNGSEWRTGLCCHVRTGTLLLGVWHLILHVLAFAVIAVLLLHPDMMNKVSDDRIAGYDIIQLGILPLESGHDRNTNYEYRNTYAFFKACKFSTFDVNMGLVVTLSTFLITALMVYGTVKGNPRYLLPFFCLQVFDFCIASLTVISYFSFVPDVRQLIANNPNIPFQKEMLELDTQWLSLIVLLTFILLMMVKAYFIGIVWSCYKFLIYRNAARSITDFVDMESDFLPPPTYETVTKDPKSFPVYDSGIPAAAAIAASMVPPPPYTPRQDETI